MQAVIEGDAQVWHFGRLAADWGNPYSARVDLLSAIYWVSREAAGPILETGSGLSTLILGAAARIAGQTVHVLEHDPDHYRTVVEALKRYGLGNVRVHYAPIGRCWHNYNRQTCLWYSLTEDQMDELPKSFAVAFCDGPQQRFGREGLFKMLGKRVADAKIIMDDAGTDKIAIEALNEWSGKQGRDKAHIVKDGERHFAVSIPPKISSAA
jgi:hypothetical protein